MQNSFFQAICRIGIFMICAQAIIHFRPKESYEKYLKLLVSVMILVQLLMPIGNFLMGKGGQDAAQALEQFRQDLEQSIAEAEESAAAADALLEKMTLEEVRSRLEAQESLSEEFSDGTWREENLPGKNSDGAQQEMLPGEGSVGGRTGEAWLEEGDLSERNPRETDGDDGAEDSKAQGIEVDAVEPIVIEVTVPKDYTTER